MSDSSEPIRPENVISVRFHKHLSKISLAIDYSDNIYFNKDDQTLKLLGYNKEYYFDIEFDSEINELLETTQFKIRVSE